MTPTRTVAVLNGSLRKASVTGKVAKALADLTPQLRFRPVAIEDLPFYDQDLETETPPAAWARFRKEISAADAVLFATPEYNRSVPAALKNAVDVGSRPWGKSVWNGKPGAVVSVSPGALGGFGANHHLRQSLTVLNVPLLSREAYVGNAFTLFDENGALINPDTSAFLRDYGAAFAAWVERILADEPARKAA